MIKSGIKMFCAHSLRNARVKIPVKACKRKIFVSPTCLIRSRKDYYKRGVFPTDLTDTSQLILKDHSPIDNVPTNNYDEENYSSNNRHCYNTINFEIKGYDIVNVEAFAQFVHRFLKQENVFIKEVFALPTTYKAIKHMGSKGNLDFMTASESLPTLTDIPIHYRIIQVSNLKSNLLPMYLQRFSLDLPMAVTISVKEYTSDEHKFRFKENEELKALKQEYAELEASK